MSTNSITTGPANTSPQFAAASPHPKFSRHENPGAPSSSSGKTNLFRQRGFGTVLATEARVWVRYPSALFFGIALPIVILLVNELLSPGLGETVQLPGYDIAPGITWAQMVMPQILALATATPFLTIMPQEMGAQREKQILKRFSGSPMSPFALVAAHFIINFAAVLVGTLITVLLAHFTWGLTWPVSPGAALLGFILGTLSMAALGTLIGSRIARATTASVIGQLVYFPMLILSGAMGAPYPLMNSTMAAVGRLTPLGAAARAMQTGWFSGPFPRFELGVVTLWILVLAPLVIKLFCWR